MTNTIRITKSDEKWLSRGVIRELIEKYKYKKNDAIDLFNKSQLLEMFHDEPEDIFHYSTSYWADFLVKMEK